MNCKADEILALRRGDPLCVRRRQMPTLGELADEYLGQHNAEQNTLRTLKARLRYATEGPKLDGQGGSEDLRADRLTVTEIGAWRGSSPNARHGPSPRRCARCCITRSGRSFLTRTSPALSRTRSRSGGRCQRSVRSPSGGRRGRARPGGWRSPSSRAERGCGPEEWLALERGDVDRGRGRRPRPPRLHGRAGEAVREADSSLRAVPLPLSAAQALEGYLRGLIPVCLPRDPWRPSEPERVAVRRVDPAVRAAGLEHRSPYALRHTYATFAIAAGVSLFELARFMGTSVDQIDKTYGHLLPDALDRTRTALDDYLGRSGRKKSVRGRDARDAANALGIPVGAPGFEPGTPCPPDYLQRWGGL